LTGPHPVPPTAPVRAAQTAHRKLLARELLASALYVTLVLLAALVAVPSDRLPPDRRLVGIIVGSSVGLLLAHWFAFRLAARITTEQGDWTPPAAQEAAAQLAGGLSVALLAAVPFLVLEGSTALSTALWLLAALPAVAGVLIARLQGRSWTFALVTGAWVLLLALAVVLVKTALGH
jgi:hypothetical protein